MAQDYVHRLEEAALRLWAELPVEQIRELRRDDPRLVRFLSELHERLEHGASD